MAKQIKQPIAPDKVLRAALEKAYAARAKLFYTQVKALNLDALLAKVKAVDGTALDWKRTDLGISAVARQTIEGASIPLHHVFAHPCLLDSQRDLLDYYRNLAALSQKGLGQLLQGSTNRNVAACRAINQILCEIIEANPAFSLSAARDVMLAEIGTEIQGSWVNLIGVGASRAVAEMLRDYAAAHRLSTKVEQTTVRKGTKNVTVLTIHLKNRWKIVFSAEPDVAIFDDNNVLQSAIEIKGSMDKAGAQTRYGEAKKSFGKALAMNPRCETIYLASCFTEAVQEQIKADGQVRKIFNLVDILEDASKRRKFLHELFGYVIRVQ